jgi:predicted transcriptional regulator
LERLIKPARKNSSPLGELELRVLKILWDANTPLGVHAVAKALGGTRAYTTIMTTLNRLHRKGYLKQRKDGRAFLYVPRMSQHIVLQKILSRVARLFYNGDMGELIPQALGLGRGLTEAERRRLKKFAEKIRDLDNA